MKSVLLGINHQMIPIPWFLFTFILRRGVKKTKNDLGDLDDEHRRVHYFVVTELPKLGKPMPPDYIAQGTGLDIDRVVEILDELERRLIFLFRPEGRDVVWAYPLTAEPTPHKLVFSSGERIWAA